MPNVSEPEELVEKAAQVRRLLATGQVTTQAAQQVVAELLEAVDAKASDYRDWLQLASQCFARLGQPRQAALTMALAAGPAAGLALLPMGQFAQ